MYRLMIVDDELQIVKSLKQLFIGRSELELEVYGVHSSSEALTMMERSQIDIVLTDIHMPGMNGIEMHREIVKRWPGCKVIFLSGCSDFECIQEVIRNGGVDYVHKSEGEKSIIRAVQKAIRALDNEIEVEDLISHSKRQAVKIRSILQKELLLQMVQSNNQDASVISERFHELVIPLHAANPVLLVLGRIDERIDMASGNGKLGCLAAIQQIADEHLTPSLLKISFEFDNKSKIAWLIQPQEEEISSFCEEELHQRVITAVREAIKSVQQTCKKLQNLKMSFAVSTTFRAWTDLAEQFECLDSLMNRGAGLGHEMLLMEREARESSIDLNNLEVRRQMKNMAKFAVLLEGGHKEQFFHEYNTLMKLVAEGSRNSSFIRMEIYSTLVSIFLSYINDWSLWEEIGAEVQLGMMMLLDWNRWYDVVEYFAHLAEVIYDWKFSRQDVQESDVISKVQHYVRHNLSGDLSLNRIAEVVGHNPSYLSRLYKRITGEGLSEFILHVKIKRTKELLGGNQLKVSEISHMVGFTSEQSFYRFFRKTTNLTPHGYREQCNRSINDRSM